MSESESKPTMLKQLLQQRDLTSYKEFRREFDRVARRLDRNASGHVPSAYAFRDWVNGRTVPRDGFRRDVLEAMFPGRTVSELLRSPDAPAPPAPKNPQEELGALLNHYRTKALVSQEALARECLLDPSYVRHAERGRAIPARRFWAEADIALAAEGALVTAYDQWAEPRNKPREGVRVLARRQLDASSPRMSELLARADASATFKERDLRGPAGARPAGDTPAGGLSRDDAPGERPARRIRTRAR